MTPVKAIRVEIINIWVNHLIDRFKKFELKVRFTLKLELLIRKTEKMHLNVKFVLLKHQIVQQTFSVTAEMQNLDVILNAEFCPQMYVWAKPCPAT